MGNSGRSSGRRWALALFGVLLCGAIYSVLFLRACGTVPARHTLGTAASIDSSSSDLIRNRITDRDLTDFHLKGSVQCPSFEVEFQVDGRATRFKSVQYGETVSVQSFEIETPEPDFEFTVGESRSEKSEAVVSVTLTDDNDPAVSVPVQFRLNYELSGKCESEAPCHCSIRS